MSKLKLFLNKNVKKKLKENFIFLNFCFCFFTSFVWGGHQQPTVEYYYFNNTQYLIFSQKVTWDEAFVLCSTYDAKLSILDNMNKAMNIAEAIAESNIEMEDAWLGGRKLENGWNWIYSNNSILKKHKIPAKSDIDDFPPWSRDPLKSINKCLAIDRRSHAHPNFIDLDCRLLRAFICEKPAENVMQSPVPAKWVNFGKYTYILYHGRVTWTEAVSYCRSQGTRLAVIKNHEVINILTDHMEKARPDFENVWIGAQYLYGQWKWMSTGKAIRTVQDEYGFPPWRYGRPEKNSGCLMLDRHTNNNPNFIEMLCDRKRDFVCEDYPSEELEEWNNEQIRFTFENATYMVYPEELSWEKSKAFCQERGNFLASITSLALAESFVEAMGNHPKELSHIWVGGYRTSFSKEWKWMKDNRLIPLEKNDFGFPPWTENVIENEDQYESLCLNLDRSDHNKPHFYGLDCTSKQSFACVIGCEEPPVLKNGLWICINNDLGGKTCSFECEKDYYMTGNLKLHCSLEFGWHSTYDWIEMPRCSNIQVYLSRMVRTLSQDVQKSSGYYILLSNSNDEMTKVFYPFVEKLLKIFPINNYFKMGLISYNENNVSYLPYEQNDTCAVLDTLAYIKESKLLPKNQQIFDKKFNDSTSWSVDILKNRHSTTTLIAFLDKESFGRNKKVFETLRETGHTITLIGIKEDWETLDSTFNGKGPHPHLYLLKKEELDTFIKEFQKLKEKKTKCTTGLTSLPDLPVTAIYDKLKEISSIQDLLESSSQPFEIGEHSTGQPIFETANTEPADDQKASINLDTPRTTLEPTEETPEYNL